MVGSLMSLVQILVRARGLDPVVVSAERALRTRLGLASRLLALRRGDLWEIEAATDDAATLVSRLVTATGLLVNPNRHRFVWRAAGAGGGSERDWGSGGLAPGALARAFILVSRLDGVTDEPILAPLARALGEDLVKRAGRVDLWTMDLAAEEAEAAAVAEEAAVTRSIHRGLLANPHYQRAVVHAGMLPARPLRSLLDGRLERRAS